MIAATHPTSLLAWIGLCLTLSSPLSFAQEKPSAAQEGKLDKFINPDAEDTSTKLEVIQQVLYQQEQEITLLMFLNEYSTRIRMSSLLLLQYKEEEALGARERVVTKIREKLKEDPKWKAFADNKQGIRVEKQVIVGDELKLVGR